MFAELSNEIAHAVGVAASSVVQVQGRRRPVSGVIWGPGVVLTTTRALGREDTLKVRGHDSDWINAELLGWDPATHLAILKADALGGSTAVASHTPPRIGDLAIAVARSWSNSVTASVGIVSVVGGPFPTGPHLGIERIIRTTAPMHDGFAGGAFVDGTGQFLGIATASSIRGLAVVIPADIAWKTATTLSERGTTRRGYVGLAGQPVRLPDSQRGNGDQEEALLVVGVTPDSPAAAAGIFVGDLLVQFAGKPVVSPEDLLGLLSTEKVGRRVPVRLRRGNNVLDVEVTIGERPVPRRVS